MKSIGSRAHSFKVKESSSLIHLLSDRIYGLGSGVREWWPWVLRLIMHVSFGSFKGFAFRVVWSPVDDAFYN